MSDNLNSDQQAALTAVSQLESDQGRAPTLEEIAATLGWDAERTREVLSTLLSGQADLVRELTAAEPAESTYAVKQRPAP